MFWETQLKQNKMQNVTNLNCSEMQILKTLNDHLPYYTSTVEAIKKNTCNMGKNRLQTFLTNG